MGKRLKVKSHSQDWLRHEDAKPHHHHRRSCGVRQKQFGAPPLSYAGILVSLHRGAAPRAVAEGGAPRVRGERRWKGHQEKGERFTRAGVFDEVVDRDKPNRERKVYPLVRPRDAVLVDNTAMGVEETACLIVMLAQEREKVLAGVTGGNS